jgi:hypothetical protein
MRAAGAARKWLDFTHAFRPEVRRAVADTASHGGLAASPKPSMNEDPATLLPSRHGSPPPPSQHGGELPAEVMERLGIGRRRR